MYVRNCCIKLLMSNQCVGISYKLMMSGVRMHLIDVLCYWWVIKVLIYHIVDDHWCVHLIDELYYWWVINVLVYHIVDDHWCVHLIDVLYYWWVINMLIYHIVDDEWRTYASNWCIMLLMSNQYVGISHRW